MKGASIPFGFAKETIARSTGRIIHDREALADKPVKQSTFSYVGSANEGNNWFRHNSPFLFKVGME
jgi:hypothetical protein